MTTITFDTYKFIRKLEGAGFATPQAEAMTEALSDVLNESTSLTLATKQDVSELRMELHDLKVDIIKWMTGALIAQAAAIAALVKLL